MSREAGNAQGVKEKAFDEVNAAAVLLITLSPCGFAQGLAAGPRSC
jgi:hypothetical protein